MLIEARSEVNSIVEECDAHSLNRYNIGQCIFVHRDLYCMVMRTEVRIISIDISSLFL